MIGSIYAVISLHDTTSFLIHKTWSWFWTEVAQEHAWGVTEYVISTHKEK